MAKGEPSERRGSRPGERRGGRKTGTPNKRTAALAKAIVIPAGKSPLEFMLAVMNLPPPKTKNVFAQLAWQNMRFEAAKAAAPYVHPRPAEAKPSFDPNDAAGKLREAARAMDNLTDARAAPDLH
jgi:hypothetical protein